MASDLVINDRASWGARPPTAKLTKLKRPVGEVIVHHGGVPSYGTGPEQMRAVQSYDIDHNGWSDIGYNFAVDRDGQIYEARGLFVGAHVIGYNTTTIGVVVFGDYRTVAVPNVVPVALGSLIGSLHVSGALADGFWVTGHSDRAATACPGGQLYLRLPEIRDRALHYGDAPPPPVPPPFTPPPLVRPLAVAAPMLHGDDVVKTQQLLAANGYNPGKVDGWYGPITAQAVRAFQQDHGLAVDGVVGAATWGALWASQNR